LLFAAKGYGQLALNSLIGYAHINGGVTCNYKVMFFADGNHIQGYSVTTMEDGTDLKATIKGTINKQKHTMAFVESDMQVNNLNSACLFDVKLNYHIRDGIYYFSGSFTGRDTSNHFCDEGTVDFEMPSQPGNPLEPDRPTTPSQRIIKPKPEPEPLTEQTNELTQVTATEQKQYEWKTDSCVFEIWDGNVVDGDIVTVFLNNKKILDNYMLVAAKKKLVLPLSVEQNMLTIMAENEGKAPPNTSNITLTDGNMHYDLLVYLQKGQSGSISLRSKHTGTKKRK